MAKIVTKKKEERNQRRQHRIIGWRRRNGVNSGENSPCNDAL